MKKMLLSPSVALVATVFTLDLPAYGNERAPYDPIVEICPGVTTFASQMKKIAHSTDLQNEACEIYREFQLTESNYMAAPCGDLLRLYVRITGGQKKIVNQIEFLK